MRASPVIGPRSTPPDGFLSRERTGSVSACCKEGQAPFCPPRSPPRGTRKGGAPALHPRPGAAVAPFLRSHPRHPWAVAAPPVSSESLAPLRVRADGCDRFRQAGGQCRFVGTVAPAGTLAQGSRARPPPSSRPARSGALADLRGCHGTVGTGPLRSQRLRVALLPGLLPGRTGSDSFVESLAAIRPRSLGWGARLRRPPRRRRGSAPPRSGRPAPWWCGLLVALPLPEPRRGPRLPPGVYRNCYARTNSHQGG